MVGKTWIHAHFRAAPEGECRPERPTSVWLVSGVSGLPQVSRTLGTCLNPQLWKRCLFSSYTYPCVCVSAYTMIKTVGHQCIFLGPF